MSESFTSTLVVENAPAGKLSLDAIHDHIRRRCFPFAPSLYPLLGMTPEDGIQNFADIVLRCKREFEEYNPKDIIANIEAVDGKFHFVDNFFDFIDLKIPADKVIFKPRAIIHFTNAFNFFSSTKAATFFRYDEGSGWWESTWTKVRLRYFIDYPFRADLTEAKDKFTDTSGIYLVEDKDQFLTLCCYRVARKIYEYSKTVPLPGYNIQLDLNEQIMDLGQAVENDKTRSSALYAKWEL